MTIHDLKTGMIVKCRGGFYGLVIGNAVLAMDKTVGGADLVDYSNSLLYINSLAKDWDIMEIYEETETAHGADINFYLKYPEKLCGNLLWKREEVVEMTLEEICKALGKNVKIIDKHS